MIKVLIADVQPMVRKGLRMRLATETDITIVGEASDGVELKNVLSEANPDVVILDTELLKGDGFATVRALREASPLIDIILLSLRGDPAMRLRAQNVGARAFIEKQEGVEKLLETLRQIQSSKGANDA
ncbi:MAG TPA: response regulator transcription factor [Anaerolineales bacterium]|nr:response regulator transcription factor [Anaerolineales bacterium]